MSRRRALRSAAQAALAFMLLLVGAGCATVRPYEKEHFADPIMVSAADTGKKVLCPMPGLVISIAVTEGQEVKAGETLAVIEAMKMQNVLRAERDGVVKKVAATPGATLAVDALILEFA